MTRVPGPIGWQTKLLQALVLLLAVAAGARVAADLLAPLVPALVVIVLLGSLCWLLFGRR